VTYKPDLSERALRQLGGFPETALGALAETIARVCDDPYDPLTTMSTDDPQVRRADFGDLGFVTFLIIDYALVLRITDVTWVA
jgi:hypothetical protein